MATIHWQFVTGKLAEPALRRVLTPVAERAGFAFTIQVLPITVAALMTPQWIARRLLLDPQATHLMLPGYCDGDLSPLQAVTTLPISIGPRDLHALPDYFGAGGGSPATAAYGAHEIEILAEINHAPRLTRDQVLSAAQQLASDGADIIDLGCQPGEVWHDVGDVVRQLRDVGLRVSIDSFDTREIAAATAAGAELVLSVNSSNRHAAVDWGCEVVAVPDDPAERSSLWETVAYLEHRNVPFCLDPILSPIGFGFANSLQGYADCRRERPDCEMLMGIGNVTELSDVDSAGINLLLLACCSEWRVRRVLTTQVINWCGPASASVMSRDVWYITPINFMCCRNISSRGC